MLLKAIGEGYAGGMYNYPGKAQEYSAVENVRPFSFSPLLSFGLLVWDNADRAAPVLTDDQGGHIKYRYASERSRRRE